MTAPRLILDLIDRFDRNTDAYRGGHYNETQVRLEFINPFFKSLGWDMDNEQGHAEAYKDVIHEFARSDNSSSWWNSTTSSSETNDEGLPHQCVLQP
jgi:hypothetical protein